MEGARWREGTQGVNGPGKYRSSGQVEEVVWCGLPLSPAVLGQLRGAWGPLAPWLYREIQQSRARVC